MKKVIFAWIVTGIFWIAVACLVIGTIFSGALENDMGMQGKFLCGAVSYLNWGWIVWKRRTKLQREIDELIEKDGEALRGALEDARTKRLLNQGCYEFNKFNKKRGIAILEYLLESCTNYSDKAVTAYRLSLMYEDRSMCDKAIRILSYATVWRPGFSQAHKRLDELKLRVALEGK